MLKLQIWDYSYRSIRWKSTKIVVGRELEDNPTLLIASQPTRGIDIGAQALIWEKLRRQGTMVPMFY